MLTDFGRTRCTEAIRSTLTELRKAVIDNPAYPLPDIAGIINAVSEKLAAADTDALIATLNLTGTVLHTNLGRASLPVSALNAVTEIATGASNLEFDIDTGHRGDRDSHVAALIQELTGAEAVTVVNNNAAAVLLCLNTLAEGREVCISRGELVEIGGSFRIPEVMQKSGCHLVELGSTNRTHLKDYATAITERTGLLLKVHTSNYEIRGFTREVSYADIAGLARETDTPFMADLGSGTLVDLENHGLAHEPTVQEVLAAGVDIVTFSGDKLLGGPQAGIIAGRAKLVDQIKQNPLKRALRVDKMTMAALVQVLKLYRHPETLADELPTLKYLSRTRDEIRQLAEAIRPAFETAVGETADIAIVETESQIGSGALPLDQLSSCAIQVTPRSGNDADLQAMAMAFRKLPVPVIGRLQDGRLLFDLRTLESEDLLAEQLPQLAI